MNISVVIPLLNEQDSLIELHDWIAKVMHSNHFSYEIIFIDDGSTDASWNNIKSLSEKDNNVIKAKGDVIITMDADLQDNPDEIPELYAMITNDGFDLVSGWKKKRFDNKLIQK